MCSHSPVGRALHIVWGTEVVPPSSFLAYRLGDMGARSHVRPSSFVVPKVLRSKVKVAKGKGRLARPRIHCLKDRGAGRERSGEVERGRERSRGRER